ncbi:FliO/MopB family protein [Spirochaeta africana]|uniref:Flagellar biogenesis protein n=1 Tax=Spirochaeta africana (strain ATCC 700263 / DSM 8902 / Z-7692) TaxID=889378 RepID=H9UKU5_SPIAZ|nr:flagellar biosynthetic protein FliO [Spirochaeta africana]AFG38138.1 flagellar biogenesis protein [Spirochaeta africana DSM 8902]
MVVLLVSAAVYGQEADTAEPAEELEMPAGEELILFDDAAEVDDPQLDAGVGLAAGGLMDLFRMLFMLALVIAMIYGVIRLLKRVQQPVRSDTSLIQLAATQPLGSSRAVHLVQVGQQVFLIGEAENSVQLVSEITDKESLDEIRLRAPLEQQAAGASFSDLLTGMFRSRTTDSDTEGSENSDTETPSLDFIQRKRERLKDL